MNKSKSSKAALERISAKPSDRFRKALTVASNIGLHPKTIHRWAAAGLIRRYKVNDRVVLFDEAEVQQFIRGACVSAQGGLKT